MKPLKPIIRPAGKPYTRGNLLHPIILPDDPMAELDNSGFLEQISKPEKLPEPLHPTSETMARFNGVRMEFETHSRKIFTLMWLVIFSLICSLVAFGMLFYERYQHARDWSHNQETLGKQVISQGSELNALDRHVGQIHTNWDDQWVNVLERLTKLEKQAKFDARFTPVPPPQVMERAAPEHLPE